MRKLSNLTKVERKGFESEWENGNSKLLTLQN